MKLGLTGTTRRADKPADGPAPLVVTPQKKERNALETKRRILEAAEGEFAAKGFDGARLGTIARAASVQQALIHHYFGDKAGLHGEVVRSGLTAMTEGVWEILSRMDAPRRASKKKVAASGKRESHAALRALAEAFVDLLLRFFATNGSFLAILRHEARRDGDGAAKIVHGSVGPIFEGIVARLDTMRARGEVKKDIDARHLVLSCVAMVAFPFQEEPFVAAIWPADWHGKAFLEERKKHIVAMILARVAP
jgi:AcrR family transcriptional regulator